MTEVFDSSDQCSDSHPITDTSENTEVTDANDNSSISDPIPQIEYDKEQVDTLLSCVGKSNLSAIHNILISIYGQTIGGYIYGKAKTLHM